MSIGIRKKRYANELKCLITLGLLTSQFCGYAQTFSLEEFFRVVAKDTLQVINTSSFDSTSIKRHNSGSLNFNAKRLIIPGAFIAVGTVGVFSGTFKKLDSHIKNSMDNLRRNHFFHADDYIQYLPAITYLTFGSLDVKAKHSFKERVVVEATAYLAMTAITNVGKYSFKEKRPDSNAKNSFPSGHTATVFTGAELMREEYGPVVGIGAYTVATGVAFLRIYNGRHLLNDVIAGAGIGVLSARIGYWMLPLYNRWFKWQGSASDIIVISSSYNPTTKSVSVNLAYSF